MMGLDVLCDFFNARHSVVFSDKPIEENLMGVFVRMVFNERVEIRSGTYPEEIAEERGYEQEKETSVIEDEDVPCEYH